MKVGEFWNFKGILLRVARKKEKNCGGCYFKENNINCTKYNFECYRTRLEKVDNKHFYGDFNAFQKVESFVKKEISIIESDLPAMEEGDKKANTKVLLDQYLEILKRMEG